MKKNNNNNNTIHLATEMHMLCTQNKRSGVILSSFYQNDLYLRKFSGLPQPFSKNFVINIRRYNLSKRLGCAIFKLTTKNVMKKKNFKK